MNTADALDAVLDPRRLSALMGQPVQATHLRIKPQVAIIAAVAEHDSARPVGWLRLLWPVSHSKAGKAQAVAQRYGTTTCSRSADELLGGTAAGNIVADWGGIASDPALAPHLWAWKNSTAHETGQDEGVRVLRYNPLRRVVAQQGNNVVRVNASADPLVAQVIHQISPFVPMPTLDADLPKAVSHSANLHHSVDLQRSAGHIIRMAHCGEGDLAHLTATAAGEGYSHQAHFQAGQIFAQLHATTRHLDPQAAWELKGRTPNAVRQGFAHAGILDHFDPIAARRVRHLSQRIQPLSGTPVLSHGDASADQVLANADLSHMWLTDFDRLCLAHPALDLGSYTALCDEATQAAFLDGYTHGGGTPPTSEELRTGQAMSLLARLAEPLKAAHPTWHDTIHQRLDRIEETLG